MNKKITAELIGIFVIGALIGLVFAKPLKVVAPAESQEPSAKSDQVDISTSSTPLTTNWKTYRNEEYGYEFKYPEELVISEVGGAVVVQKRSGVVSGGDISGEVFIKYENKAETTVNSIIDFIGRQFDDRSESREDIVINGSPALRVIVTAPTLPWWYSDTIYIERGNKIWIIDNGALKNSFFDPIVSTFKFTQ